MSYEFRLPDGTIVFRAATGTGFENDPHRNHDTLVHPTSGAALIGQAARAGSLPVALATEDVALLASILAALASVSVTGPITNEQLRAAALAITATSLPLPIGASTEGTLEAVRAVLASILAAGATEETAAATLAALQGTAFYPETQPVSGTVGISGTVPVSAASLPLAPDAATQTTSAAILAALQGSLVVDGSAVTQPVSLASVPLASNAATEQTTTAILSALQAGVSVTGLEIGDITIDGVATEVTSAAILATLQAGVSVTGVEIDGVATETTLDRIRQAVEGTLAVSGPVTNAELRNTPLLVSGTFYPETQPISGTVGITGTVGVTGEFFQSTQPVSLATIPLAPNAATQTTLEAIRELLAAGVDVEVTNQIAGFATQTTLAALLSAVQAGIAVTGPLTDAQARATPLPVSGPLTDTQLRATPIEVSGSFTSTGLTDTELRASAIAVSGPLTDTQLRATPLAVSGTVATGGLTDTQLRATAIPISGTVTANGPLTDAQIRATPLPVSLDTIPLAPNAATQTTLATLATQTTAAAILSALQGVIDVDVTNQITGFATQTTLEAARVILAAIQTAVEGTVTVDGSGVTQPVSLATIPLASGAASEPTLEAARVILAAIQTAVQGTLTVGGTVGISGTVPVSGTFWPTTQPVSLTSQPLPTGAATDATLAGGVGLRPDDAASRGVYTLSATPNTVTSITVPAGARIAVLSEASARVNWNINADPVAAGTNALAAGGDIPAFERESIILRPDAATLRISSATASATVRVAFRGVGA